MAAQKPRHDLRFRHYGAEALEQLVVIGASGFSAANTYPNLLAIVLVPAWSAWLVVWSFTVGERNNT